MKKIIFLIMFLFVNCGFISFCYADETLDRIVAVVNDDVVTQSELDNATKIAKTQLSQQSTSIPSDMVLQKQVLDQLINKKVQLQAAKMVGIKISDSDLDKTISGIAQQNHLTDHELYERIKQEGFSVADYRGELREQITIQKLQQQEVINHIAVTPEEINRFISSKAWQSHGNNEYHLEDLLVPVSDTPSPRELSFARKYAQTLMEKINKGANFHGIAEEGSSHNSLNIGDLGFRGLAEIPSAFAEKVVEMKKDTIAGPIQTANGFHIIKLVDVRSPSNDTAQAPDRKQVERLLMQRKFEEAVQNWVSKLRGQAYISIKIEKA